MSWLEFSRVASSLVMVSRVAIGVVGLWWWSEARYVETGVAVVALFITMLPGLFVPDPTLRSASAVVAGVLLGAHVVFGMHGSLYETSLIYDKAMHVLGSAAVAALLAIWLYQYCHRRRLELPVLLVAALVMGGTVTAGTLWEMFEFAVDRTGLFYAQRGLVDTMVDLFADAGGATLVVAVLWVADSVRGGHSVSLPMGRG